MTDHGLAYRTQNRVPPALAVDVECFRDSHFAELAAVYAESLTEDGLRRCDQPDCGQFFRPKITGQLYCSRGCKQPEVADRRAVGLVMAPALLAWRTHKHAKPGTAGHVLCRAARNYVSRVQTNWLERRRARAKNAEGGSL